ncbi:MAG: hypothetical protein P4M14_03000 [Gammaproteobacteria bacterium]|nr:hypothetical protein [Gammaproteobacteria bacterium]
MPKIIHWLKQEIIHLIPIIIYFAICFNLFHFAQSLILPPDSIRFTSYWGATLGAILAGKVILIADSLPFINAFPEKPIVYNITWKFVIYSFFVFLVQVIDNIIRSLYSFKDWSIACAHLKADISQSMFWGIQISVLMFFLGFIVFSELTRVIGKSKIDKIFFG